MWWVVLVALAFWSPRLALAGAAVGGAVGAARLARVRSEQRRERRVADADVVVLAELCVLGLSAGLTMRNAMRAAAPVVAPLLGQEVHRVLRHSTVVGTEAAFASAGGRVGPLCRLVARALASGAPLGEVVAGHAAAERHREQSRRLAAGRRLPVLLLIPLALLILPGFVLIAAGPALLGGLARLGL